LGVGVRKDRYNYIRNSYGGIGLKLLNLAVVCEIKEQL
jgi:hypothetical protein